MNPGRNRNASYIHSSPYAALFLTLNSWGSQLKQEMDCDWGGDAVGVSLMNRSIIIDSITSSCSSEQVKRGEASIHESTCSAGENCWKSKSKRLIHLINRE